jgi:branched-chain amino acid transport system ATP-binding protein
MVGCHVRQKAAWWESLEPAIFRCAAMEEKAARAKSLELLRHVGLADLFDEKASSLPYGAQRRLEIARALATEPHFLLLDEPAAGMNPQETQELMAFIRRLRDEFKLTILLIEHDMKVVMGVCEHIWVLDYGALIAEGDGESIRQNPKVIEAYLGEQEIEGTVTVAPTPISDPGTSRELLNIRNLDLWYGGVHAIKGIDLNIRQGEIVTLIGANGAGKSSIIRAITGMVHSYTGDIDLFPCEKKTRTTDRDGKRSVSLVKKNPEEIVKLGVAISPEGRCILPHLTVTENLRLGAFTRNDEPEILKDIDYAFTLFPRLKERSWQKGGTLSGGEQQMLAVARALMSRPDLLILDEPSLGLAPILVAEVFDIICEINRQGKTILLVEQNAYAALKVAHTGYVLEVGNVVAKGTGGELLNDPRIREAYLGG